jgi:hypothetical protein
MNKEPQQELAKNNSKYGSIGEIRELCLLSLIDSYKRVKTINRIASCTENEIRDYFIIDMEANNGIIKDELENNTLRIIPESWDPSKKRRADIVFFISNYGDFTFECKKLTSAEDRYLNDGLIRFIRLDYAEKEDEAGMIGFILNTNIPLKLKEKVRSFNCISLIDKLVLDFPYSFWSKHTCKNSKEILISHLFFYFSKK